MEIPVYWVDGSAWDWLYFSKGVCRPAGNTINAILGIVQDIQAKVNSSVFGLQAIKNAVDTKASQASVNGISTKLDAMPGRVVTFNNLQLNLAAVEDYEILRQDKVGHGIYVDITVSGIEPGEELTLFCLNDSGFGAGRILENREYTLDWGCDGLDFSNGTNNPLTATINGKIRYTNEYISSHDIVASP